MAVDPAVIAAIRAALSENPDNLALRNHLADLLGNDGQHAEALFLAEETLRRRPDDLDALRIAGDCADAMGEDDRARAFRRLRAALGAEDRHSSTQRAAPIDAPGRIPDTADELVEHWRESAPAVEPELGALSRPTLRLADVGGMTEVKRRIDLSFLAPLRSPELRSQFGKSLRGGLLLWGPPGCGKTYLARALAGELGAHFYEVGLNDVLDMWIGSSERNLHAIFEVAREHSPCLLFFDEIDALGHKRSNLRAGAAAMRGVVNQLLAELDGARTDNEGVFVLAASNHPWDVDPALLRPGRFDRSLFVMPPDEAARSAILELHLRGKPAEKLNLARIARATEGLSGADLALICDSATERALEESVRDGQIRPINQQDLVEGMRAVKSSIRPWLEIARNYAQFGNGAGAYDELAEYLRQHRR
jgi:SpoVK/Ycf46/Vps4 family AAA+-type ATPase